MTVKSSPAWKAALRLLSIRLVLAQLCLAVGALMLFAVWLRLPDASALEVIGSGLFAVFIIGVAGIGESRIILGLAGRAPSWSRVLRGMLPVLVGAALCFAWSAWLAHLGENDPLRAGYLNSRAPQHLRHLFTFEHILLWVGWMWSIVFWIGAGFFMAFVFALVAGGRPLRAALAALRSASFWFVLLVGAAATTLFTGALMSWLPLHGLWPEMFSLGFRLTIAAAMDAFVACWFLATLAICLRRADAPYVTSAGGPEDNQLRTVEAP